MVNNQTFPHFARNLIIAAIFYQLHEYIKLNMECYLFYRRVPRMNSLIFWETLRYWRVLKLVFNLSAFANWTWLSTRNTGFLLRIKFPSFHLNDGQLFFRGTKFAKTFNGVPVFSTNYTFICNYKNQGHLFNGHKFEVNSVKLYRVNRWPR